MDEMTNSIVSDAKKIAVEAGLNEAKTVVREGKPARALLEYAKSNGIDLIVVGSRGVGEVDSALLGSVSQKVGMLSECTVMIVR